MTPEPTGWRASIRTLFDVIEHWLYVALAALLSITCILALAGAADALIGSLPAWSDTETVFVIIDRLLVVLMLVMVTSIYMLRRVRLTDREGSPRHETERTP
jgi:hypothetical protein